MTQVALMRVSSRKLAYAAVNQEAPDLLPACPACGDLSPFGTTNCPACGAALTGPEARR